MLLLPLPAIVILIALGQGAIIGVVSYFADIFPPCRFYAATGLLCPGCGNTRSVAALVYGDILGSLRYNAFIIFVLLLGLAFYAENLVYLLGKSIKIVPRSNAFLFISLGLFIMYFIARNILSF